MVTSTMNGKKITYTGEKWIYEDGSLVDMGEEISNKINLENIIKGFEEVKKSQGQREYIEITVGCCDQLINDLKNIHINGYIPAKRYATGTHVLPKDIMFI